MCPALKKNPRRKPLARRESCCPNQGEGADLGLGFRVGVLVFGMGTGKLFLKVLWDLLLWCSCFALRKWNGYQIIATSDSLQGVVKLQNQETPYFTMYPYCMLTLFKFPLDPKQCRRGASSRKRHHHPTCERATTKPINLRLLGL